MIILTGGAGFIGSAFLRTLNDQGRADIIVVDNLDKGEKWRNLTNKQVIDYLNKEQFIKLIESHSWQHPVDAIVHLGACSSTIESDAEYMMQNNYCYSKTLAQWSVQNKVRFIYASSAATYGDGENGFSDDLNLIPKLRPLNPYALSKQLFDIWALNSKALDKIAGIKFFNVYGPNEYHKGEMSSVIFKAYRQILETGQLKLFKSHRPDYQNGEQQRDFVYVKDCCAVLSWLLDNTRANGIFNLGTGTAHTWNELAASIFSAMKLEPKVEYIDMPEQLRDKYQYFTQAEMKNLTSLGCSPQFTEMNEAVKDYIQNHLAKEQAIY